MNLDDAVFQVLMNLDKGVHYCFDHLHDAEVAMIDLIELLLSPKLVVRQVAIICGLQLFVFCYQTVEKVVLYVKQTYTTRGKLEKHFIHQLSTATSYTEWL